MQKILAIIGGLLVLVGGTVGAIEYFTPRPVFKEACIEFQADIAGLSKSFYQQQIAYQIDQALSIMWKIESKYGHKDYLKYSATDRDIYLQQKRRIEKLQREQN